jgi:hypothetical protein
VNQILDEAPSTEAAHRRNEQDECAKRCHGGPEIRL